MSVPNHHEGLDAGVLEWIDVQRLGQDVKIKNCLQGRFIGSAHDLVLLVPQLSHIDPVVEHLESLELDVWQCHEMGAVKSGSKRWRVLRDALLVHSKQLLWGPDFELYDFFTGFPSCRLALFKI